MVADRNQASVRELIDIRFEQYRERGHRLRVATWINTISVPPNVDSAGIIAMKIVAEKGADFKSAEAAAELLVAERETQFNTEDTDGY